MNRQLGLLLVTLAMVLATGAALQELEARQRLTLRPAELWEVVRSQIAALQAEEFTDAYARVSNDFQGRFDLAAFTDLARHDYPALRFARRVEFGAVRRDGRHALVPAYFFLPGGEVVPCLWSLVYEGRSWKIDGVTVQKRWRSGQRLGGVRT